MRDAFVTYSYRDGMWTISLREHQVVKETRRVEDCTDIGKVILNWVFGD